MDPLVDVFTWDDLGRWSDVTGGMPRRPCLAVLGHPVAHSRSPQMHNPALAEAGLSGSYVRIDLRPEEFSEAMTVLPQLGFLGANVTIPYKAAAFAAVSTMSEVAKRCGAVNTLAFTPAGIAGHNTDAPGLRRALHEAFGVELADQRILILGAGGGAGQAAAVQCAMDGCRRLVLVNRTLAKAEHLAAELGDLLPGQGRLLALSTDEGSFAREIADVDLIINASSVGMKESDPELVPAQLWKPDHLVYDMIYAPPRTRLLQEAAAAGARTANGLGMLLWQGALAFEYWFRQAAPIEVMRRGLS
jgi:shikimate dehydrogenase